MKNSDMPAMPTYDVIETCSADGNEGPFLVTDNNSGLSKREHFAAMAMQGMLANTDMMKVVMDSDEFASPWDDYAEQAIKQADALLAALEGK